MSRPSTVVRAVPRLIALVLALLLVVAVAPAQAAPKYGPYSSEFYDLSARVSPSKDTQARTYLQVRRNRDQSGDRQLYLSWRIQGGKSQRTKVRNLAPGHRTTFVTSRLKCGKTMKVVLHGRGRAPGGTYSDWKQINASVKRTC